MIGQVEGERGGGPLTLGLGLSAEGERGGGGSLTLSSGLSERAWACPAAEPRSARAGPAPLSRVPGPGPSADLGRVFLTAKIHLIPIAFGAFPRAAAGTGPLQAEIAIQGRRR